MMKLILSLALVILWTIPSYPSDAGFRPGERLHYVLTWSGIKSGELSLEVAPMETVMDEECWHFVMKAKTTKFVDIFYKLRNRVDAYTDRSLTRSLLYIENKRGFKSKEKKIQFDYKKLEAFYIKNGRLKRVTKIAPSTYDPLSVFYHFRVQSLLPGTIIKAPISDGKKFVIGEARVMRKEKVLVGDKSYDCVLVIPDLKHVGGVFAHGRGSHTRIWFTADPHHIPVKIETKLKIGSFIMLIESISEGSI